MTRQLKLLKNPSTSHQSSHPAVHRQQLVSVRPRTRHSRTAVLHCTATAVAAPPSASPYKKAKLNQDYAAVESDSEVLKRPLKDNLTAEEVKNVFGYSRDLREWYSIGKILGAGSFGVVREAVHKPTSRKYACKTIPKIPKRGQGTPRYLLKLQTEVDAMQQLGPSFDAVSLKGVFEDDDSIHIVMELCLGGALMDRVKQGTVTEKKIARIIRSILRFITQCHAKGVIYRDVKPDNFLFLSKDDNSPLRATDFGLSIRHKAEDGKLKSRSGTPVYMAPEVIMQEYGPVADEWSVGMLMYQLLTGVFPFWDSVQNVSLQQVWQAILVKKVDLDSKQAQAMMSEGARHLLKGLLTRNPRDRLTAAKALDHPWVREGGEASEEPLALGNTLVQRLQRHATYGLFKQMVLQLIADDVIDNGHDPNKTFATLRDVFNRLDADKSGGVSIEELSRGLVDMGYLVSKDEMETLMSRIDLNDNGNIEFEEFAAGMLDWRQMQQDTLWSRWVDIAFGKLDSNGDGFIDLDELLVRLPVLTGTDNPEAERVQAARRMLREGDTNGDGLVCKEEFTHLLQAGSAEDSLDAYDGRWSANRVVLGPGEHSTNAI